MNQKPGSCRGCALETRGTGYVPFYTETQRPLILAVGEAPGQSEANLGRPFVGKSGMFLDRLFRMTGIKRSEWAFHNVLSCQPPWNKLRDQPYRTQAIYQCGPNLDRTIETLQPKIIVGFGDTALERLTGKSGIQRYRGFWLIGPRGIPVMPTFHPAYLLPGRTEGELRKDRPSRFIGAVLWDLMRAQAMATSNEPFRRPVERYLVDPPPAVFADFAREYKNQLANKGPALLLTHDIETPGKAAKGIDAPPMLQQPVIRIAFAFEAGYSVSVRFEPAYMATMLELLGTTGHTTGWNSFGFDNPVLEYNIGRPFVNGPHWDMMRAWHVLQSDLPKKLEFVASFFTTLFPWKDLAGTDPGRYNAIDGDAQIQCSYGIRENLQGPLGGAQWKIFEELVMGIAPALKTAGQRGVPVDVEAQAQLREELRRDLLDEFIKSQSEVPASFYQRKIYVRKPNRTHAEIEIDKEVPVCSACGAERPTVVHYRATKTRPACPGNPVPQMRTLPAYLALMDLDPARGLDAIRDEIGECGFNPLSVPQLTAYAESFRHLQLLRNSGTKVEGLDDSVLKALAKRFGKEHPIYARTQTIREKNKKLGTYVEGYAPDENGFIHTTFSDNPSTLRLASQDVNLQNVHAEIKKTIRARPGWRFLEVDGAAIQAVLWGYQIQSAKYIRLAAQGVHDFVLAKKLGLDWEYPTVLKKTKTKDNKKLRDSMKITVHGSNFGGTPRTIKSQNPEAFATERECFELQNFYFQVCPEVPEGQRRIRATVARSHVLINPWGFHQYFYEVFDGDGPGQDYNRCLAAGPQSMEALIMRENVALMKDTEWAEFMYGNCTTHDSLGLYLPDEKTEAAEDFLIQLMTRPIPQLDNLRIGAESKASPIGGTWAEMQERRVVRFEDPLELSSWHRELETIPTGSALALS